MKNFNQNSFKKDILQDLLDSEGFIGSKSQENVKGKKGFFLGFRGLRPRTGSRAPRTGSRTPNCVKMEPPRQIFEDFKSGRWLTFCGFFGTGL